MKYICEKCQKIFTQKGHLEDHQNRKRPCKKSNTMEELVENKVRTVLIKIEAERMICKQSDITSPATMNYSKMTRDDLIALCKERGLKGYSGKKKIILVEMLTSAKTVADKADKSIISSIDDVREDEKVEENVEDSKDVPPDDGMGIEKNSFIVGDNVILMKKLLSETIDMIYMDPPYNTGRNFHYFQDKFADFPKFMEERIIQCHRILKPNGNIIIHVEPRISHHIRIICDKIFGENHFQNEIVWHTGGNAKNKHQLGRNHDTIIVYSKSSHSKFFPLYHPYTDDHKKGAKMCPNHNKLYTTSAAHNSQPEVNPRPNLKYEWNGHIRQWYVSIEKMRALHEDHRLEYNREGIPRIKRFLDEMDGIPVRDTWDDISSIQNGEKTKYATQKPILLLERVLALYSTEGDLCMDPFAGSGTLGRACRNMKRDYILLDINPEAKEVFDKTV